MKITKRIISLIMSVAMFVSLAAGLSSTAYAKAISAEDMARKFAELKEKYPEGSKWNKAYVVNGMEMSWQCMGWAETVCDYLFGENPRNWAQQTKWDNMCVGDHVRLYYKGEPNNHSIVITDMVGDTVYYADCNGDGDGKVHWGKSMKKSQLISKAVWFKSQNDNWVRTLSGAGSGKPQQSSGSTNSSSGEWYNFACVSGGRYLNVYAGNDWDGVNVCVWDADGSKEQNFKADNRGGNKYAFYPQSSNGRVLDANRGNSYSNPLKAGNNIDLWRTNDAPAQEWYICDRGGGKYSIELASSRNLVIGCDSPNKNGGNCSLQNYNGSDSQLWYLKRNGGGSININIESIPAPPAPEATPEPTLAPEPEFTPEPTPPEVTAPLIEDNYDEKTDDMPIYKDDESDYNDYYEENRNNSYDTEQNEWENQIILTIGQTKAIVFGKTKHNDVAPILRNNRTMLPARFLAESLGAEVEWDEDIQLVTITNGSTTILIFVNSDKAYVNGKSYTLDSPAFTENDRTYTPVRFITEALDCDVEWDDADERVTITKR